MRLAVFDTNVIVSAAIRPGSPPSKLITDWVLEGLVEAVTCPAVVEEYRLVTSRPKFLQYGFPPPWLEFLIEESLHLPDAPAAWVTEAPDRTDLSFLGLAHVSGSWLVTGNVKHFPQSLRNGVQVITPTDYLNHLQGA